MASNQQIQEIGRGTGGAVMPGRDRGDGEDRGRNIGDAIAQQARRFPASSPQFPAREQSRTSPDRKQQKRNVAQGERALSMMLGGSLLAMAISRRGPGAIALGLASAGLLHRGATGHCYGYQALGMSTARSGQEQGARHYATEVQRSMTINRPADELYRTWRDPENLRRIMEHFADVRATGETTAHWKMPIPMMGALQWDTRIIEERAGQMISWESLPGSSLQNDGRLQFSPATGNRGTVVTLRLRFNPPMGALGSMAAKTMRVVPSTIAMRALHRFKNLVETGEIATSARDTSGRRSLHNDAAQKRPVMGMAMGLGWFSIGLGAAELLAPNGLARMIGVPRRAGLIRMCGLRELAAGFGLLSRRKPAMWLWSRVAGDAMDLSLLASSLKSRRAQPERVWAATAAVIGVTVLDAWSAMGFGRKSSSGISNWEQSGLLHRR